MQRKNMVKLRLGLALIVVSTAIIAVIFRGQFATLWYIYQDYQDFPNENARPPKAKFNLPLVAPATTEWQFRNAFPKIQLEMPIVANLSIANQVFVLERMGRIWTFENAPSVSHKHLVVDFSEEVGEIHGEEGAVGLAIHPKFGKDSGSNYIYTFYTSCHNDMAFDRVVRFTVDPVDLTIDPDTQIVLINQKDEHHDHQGGDLHFGKDGFLYVSLGDEGNCQCGNEQRINRDLFSGILRIDVDMIGGDVSHPIVNQPETGQTSNYYIPNDNPFVGIHDALEEFWAIGLRNPYRMSFDEETERLFAADAGVAKVESIVEIKKGSNHRWSYYEGNQKYPATYLKGKKPDQFFGVETAPIFAYNHGNLNHCVIGGYVYRGKTFPALDGLYIYGDNVSGRIWALNIETGINQYLTSLNHRANQGLAGFAQDRSGELYAIVMGSDTTGGHILALTKEKTSSRELPNRLSQTELFDKLHPLTPQSAAFEYEIELPLWNGHRNSTQRQWILFQNFKSRPRFSAESEWLFSGGSILIKQLYLGDRKVETQILVLNDRDSGYPLSYKWNDEQTEAFLVEESHSANINGDLWRFGDPNECAMCHSSSNGIILGLNTRQLNMHSQLLDLRKKGLFVQRKELTERWWGPQHPIKFIKELNDIHERLKSRPLISQEQLGSYPRLAKNVDTYSLEERVSSYLDVNCAHCHHPGGMGGNSFDARYSTSMFRKGIIYGRAQRPIDGIDALILPGEPENSLILHRLKSTDSGEQMPPFSALTPDPQGIELLQQWINSLQN